MMRTGALVIVAGLAVSVWVPEVGGVYTLADFRADEARRAAKHELLTARARGEEITETYGECVGRVAEPHLARMARLTKTMHRWSSGYPRGFIALGLENELKRMGEKAAGEIADECADSLTLIERSALRLRLEHR